MLPLIVIGPIAGVLVDRWNRRALLLVAHFVRIGCAMGMFLSTSVWQLYVLVLLAAIMQAMFLATYSATIPQITQEQFTKSISLSYMGYKTMQVIGSMVAAIIIGLTCGSRAAFLFDTATFVVGFLMTLTISVANVERKDATKNFLHDLGIGLSFLWKNAATRYIASYNVVFIVVSAASTLGTILYIKMSLGLSATLSDQLYGITGAVLAGSMALIAWLIGLLDEWISRPALMFYAPVVAGLTYLLFLLHPGPTWILPIFFVVSVGNACGLLSFQTLLAQFVPNDLRRRVYSFFNAIGSVANLAAYGLFAMLGLLLPPAMLLALAGLILLVGIPLCTLVFKGHQALHVQEAGTKT